jgi:hypothetical protein
MAGYTRTNWITNTTIKEGLGIFNLGDHSVKYTDLNGKLVLHVDAGYIPREMLTYWAGQRMIHPVLKWQDKYALQWNRTGHAYA